MDSTGGVITKLGSKVVYANRWMTVTEDQVERPDGSCGIFGVVHKPDFALIIPSENGGFHMVEEYRYPIGKRTWSFPQGTLPNKQHGVPEELARLELAQETGHVQRSCASWAISTVPTEPVDRRSRSSSPPTWNRAATIESSKNRTCGRHGSPRRVHAMVDDGRITDDSTIAAYALPLIKGL